MSRRIAQGQKGRGAGQLRRRHASIVLTGIPSFNTAQVGSAPFQLVAVVYSVKGAVLIPPRITWDSSDPAAATVTQEGLVTVISAGSSRISASVQDGAIDFFDLTVTPLGGIPVQTGIRIIPTSVVLDANGFYQFTVEGVWSDGVTKTVGTPTWSDNGVGSINASSGYYSAGSAGGSCVVTVNANGFQATAAVTVNPPVAGSPTYEINEDWSGYSLGAAGFAEAQAAAPTKKLNYAQAAAGSTIVQDPYLGRRVLRQLYPLQTPGYDLQNYRNGIPGVVSRIYGNPTTPLEFIWARSVFRWPQPMRHKDTTGQSPPGYAANGGLDSSHNVGGFDAAGLPLGPGIDDPSPLSASHKIMFFQWDSTPSAFGVPTSNHPDRQDLTYVNYGLVPGLYRLRIAQTVALSPVQRVPAPNGIPGTGNLTPHPLGAGYEMTTRDYLEVISMYHRVVQGDGLTLASECWSGFWLCMHTLNGVINTDPLRWTYVIWHYKWMGDGATYPATQNMMAPRVKQVQFFVNKNHGNCQQRLVDKAFHQVLNGNLVSANFDPYTLPGTWG